MQVRHDARDVGNAEVGAGLLEDAAEFGEAGAFGDHDAVKGQGFWGKGDGEDAAGGVEQGVFGGLRDGLGLLKRVQPALDEVVDRGEQQGWLVGEAFVEGAFRDPGGGGHAFHARTGVAVAQEEGRGLREDSGAQLGGGFAGWPAAAVALRGRDISNDTSSVGDSSRGMARRCSR